MIHGTVDKEICTWWVCPDGWNDSTIGIIEPVKDPDRVFYFFRISHIFIHKSIREWLK
jgi:hypothetical protein